MAQVEVTFKGLKGEQKGFEMTDAAEIDGVTFPRGVAVPVDATFAQQIRDDPNKWYEPYRFGFADIPGDDIPTPDETPVVEETTQATPSILDGTVDEVKAALPTLTADDLTALRQQEVDGKNRKGVLDAIDARTAELAAS